MRNHAIADGKVTLVIEPKSMQKVPPGQLNEALLSPQLYCGAWTDNGCVVIEHTTLEGGNITFGAPGKLTVKAGQHKLVGGNKRNAKMPAFPESRFNPSVPDGVVSR